MTEVARPSSDTSMWVLCPRITSITHCSLTNTCTIHAPCHHTCIAMLVSMTRLAPAQDVMTMNLRSWPEGPDGA